MVAIHCIKDCFFSFRGIWQSRLKGDWQWCVLHWHCEMRCWKSMALRGLLSFFGTTTILLYHLTGSCISTGSIILFATSLSRLCLTFSFQWNGIGIGTCWTYGWLLDLRCIWAGLVDIDEIVLIYCMYYF